MKGRVQLGSAFLFSNTLVGTGFDESTPLCPGSFQSMPNLCGGNAIDIHPRDGEVNGEAISGTHGFGARACC